MPTPPFYAETEVFNTQPIFAMSNDDGKLVAVTFRDIDERREPVVPINTLGRVVNAFADEPTVPDSPRNWKIRVAFSNGVETTLPPSILRKAEQLVSEKLSS